MKLISHRGNIAGPISKLENSPAYLFNAIESGYDVEVDVWISQGMIYLGHDAPTYLVDEQLITELSRAAWFHCKNYEAFNYFLDSPYRFFSHDKDPYAVVLGLNRYIWCYPGQPVPPKRGIEVLPEWNMGLTELSSLLNKPIFGVCSDYVELIR